MDHPQVSSTICDGTSAISSSEQRENRGSQGGRRRVLTIQPHMGWVIPRSEGATRLEYSYRSCWKTIRKQRLSLVSVACGELCCPRLVEGQNCGGLYTALDGTISAVYCNRPEGTICFYGRSEVTHVNRKPFSFARAHGWSLNPKKLWKHFFIQVFLVPDLLSCCLRDIWCKPFYSLSICYGGLWETEKWTKGTSSLRLYVLMNQVLLALYAFQHFWCLCSKMRSQLEHERVYSAWLPRLVWVQRALRAQQHWLSKMQIRTDYCWGPSQYLLWLLAKLMLMPLCAHCYHSLYAV